MGLSQKYVKRRYKHVRVATDQWYSTLDFKGKLVVLHSPVKVSSAAAFETRGKRRLLDNVADDGEPGLLEEELGG